MRRPKKRSNRWLWIIVSLVVVVAVAYGIVRTTGSRPKKQELDLSPGRKQLDGSIDRIVANLVEALRIRDQVQAGQTAATQAHAELDSLRLDLERVAADLGQAAFDPTLVQAYERVTRFAGNSAKQVGALASDASPDSLSRTEARILAMLTAAGRLRATVAPRPGNPS